MKLIRTTRYQFGWLIWFPLLDVLFLIIFFLLLSSNFVLQPGISVNVPLSKFMLAPPVKYEIISITSGGVPAIYFRDQPVTQEEFAKRLGELPVKERTLIVKADRAAPYEVVAGVMNEGLKLGFSVVLAGSERTK